MFGERKKQIMLICLCLSVLFAILACTLANSPSGGNSLAPVRSLILTIDTSQREKLFDQLQKYADDHALKLVLTNNEKAEHFLVEMWGDDILITASDVPPDPTLVYIFFYWQRFGDPVDEEGVQNLLNDLKDFVNEIPNVTIEEP